MDKDRIVGATRDFAGKVEGAAGDLAGDAKTQATARAREAAGTVQNLYGQAKDAAREAGEAAGNGRRTRCAVVGRRTWRGSGRRGDLTRWGRGIAETTEQRWRGILRRPGLLRPLRLQKLSRLPRLSLLSGQSLPRLTGLQSL